jgi:hypothetical protein
MRPEHPLELGDDCGHHAMNSKPLISEHDQIAEDHIGLELSEHLQRLEAVPRRPHLRAQRLEEQPEGLANVLLIVRHQNGRVQEARPG